MQQIIDKNEGMRKNEIGKKDTISLYYKFVKKDFDQIKSFINIKGKKLYFSHQKYMQYLLRKYDLSIKHINYFETLVQEGQTERVNNFTLQVIFFHIKYSISVKENYKTCDKFSNTKTIKKYEKLLNNWKYIHDLAINFCKSNQNNTIQDQIQTLQNLLYIIEIYDLYQSHAKKFEKSLCLKDKIIYKNFKKETDNSILTINFSIEIYKA
jgi:hypothetical protein